MPQLPFTPKQMAEFMQISRTEPGKKLLNLLQQEKGDALRCALNCQDYDRARRIVEDFLSLPEAQDLIRKLGR